jgi:uncharacterized membrane protein YqjE
MPQTIVNGHRSTGEIIQEIVGSLGEIVRSEIRMARVEIAGKARSAGKAAALFGSGLAVLAGAGLVALAALVAALALVMPVWLAALIVSILLLAAGGFMVMVGWQRLTQVDARPAAAIDSVKEDVAWLKQSIR